MNGEEIQRDLVLVGGGHAHVGVLRMLGMKPIRGVRITLVSKGAFAPYSGMLPGYLAGHYDWRQALIDLRPLCRFAGAQFYQEEVTGLDPEHRFIHCAKRPPISYDIVSLNVGSSPNLAGVDPHEGLIPVKPLESFLQHWPGVIERVVNSRQDRFRIVVVGSGAGGVELTLAAHFRLRNELKTRGHSPDRLEMQLLTSSDSLLPRFNAKTGKIFARIFKERGIETRLRQTATGFSDGVIRCASGEDLPCDLAFWVTHAAAPQWLADTGLDLDSNGFVALNDRLQSTSHPGVFSAGDVASVGAHPRPKAGVFAVRQGPPLAENLERAITGDALLPFTPQKNFLSIISTGDRYAVASRGPFAVEGTWVWRWKDFIDLRWMRKYQDLPEMEIEVEEPFPGEEPKTDPMRCGGCGSKIGKVLLSNVIARLNPRGRDDVHIGLDEPDDAAVLRVPEGHLLVQSVDGFRAFLNDPYVFGQITAEHALSDLFAMGATASSAQVNVTIPVGRAGAMEEQLFQLMSGIMEVLDRHEVVLAGGHTVEGDELEAGLVVNGFAREQDLLTKDGAQAGDRLILTKPLGTGTLLAADMRGKANGNDLQTALDLMRHSNRQAVEVLRDHQVTALTDVTGFGLIGHLLEMMEPAGMDAELRAESVPVISGALATVKAGILSSLQPENERMEVQVEAAEAVRNTGRWPLLFDPQTSGGLLAGVPDSEARACRDALRKAGYEHAEIIGRVKGLTGRESRVFVV